VDEVSKQLSSPAWWILSFLLGGLTVAVIAPYVNKRLEALASRLGARFREWDKTQAETARARLAALIASEALLRESVEEEMRGRLNFLANALVAAFLVGMGVIATWLAGATRSQIPPSAYDFGHYFGLAVIIAGALLFTLVAASAMQLTITGAMNRTARRKRTEQLSAE
jgi:MFS family permease